MQNYVYICITDVQYFLSITSCTCCCKLMIQEAGWIQSLWTSQRRLDLTDAFVGSRTRIGDMWGHNLINE